MSFLDKINLGGMSTAAIIDGTLAALVRRAHGRLDEFSEESSPALKELKRDIEAIERALKYLRDNNLEPGVLPKAPDETNCSGPATADPL